MLNVFKIGVAIGMTNNVSQTLHVIQRDLFGLNRTVDLTTKKFNLMKLAALGAMTAITGAAALKGVGDVVAAGAQVVHQQQLMKSAGMSNLEIARATAAAWKTTSSVLGTGIVQNLQSVRELRIAFSSAAAENGGNTASATAAAVKYMPIMQTAQMLLGSTLGKDSEGQVYDYAKALEMVGATQDPTRFAELLDGMVRAAEASGGKVTGTGYFQAIKYGRTAALGWDNSFITDVLPLLIQEYGASNGGKGGPGNALMSAFQAVVGGKMTNKSAEEFYKLGLLNLKDIIFTSTGNIKGIRPGGVEGAAEFTSNPYQWTQDYLMPALKKDGITNKSQILDVISHLFDNRTAASIMAAFTLQQARFQGSADETNQAQGLSAWQKLVSGDLTTGWSAFTQGLGNLMDALGSPLVPVATKWLHLMTVEISKMTLWASAHPGIVKKYGEIVAGAAAALVALGTLAVSVAVGGMLLNGLKVFSLSFAGLRALFLLMTTPVEALARGLIVLTRALAVGARLFLGFAADLLMAVGPVGWVILGVIAALIAVGVAAYAFRKDLAKIPVLLDDAGRAFASFFQGIAYIATHPLADIKHLGSAIGGVFNGPAPLPPSAYGLKTTGSSFLDSIADAGRQPIAPPVTAFTPPPVPPTPTYNGPIPVHVTNPKDIHNGVAQSFTKQLLGIQTGPTGFDYSSGFTAPAGAY